MLERHGIIVMYFKTFPKGVHGTLGGHYGVWSAVSSRAIITNESLVFPSKALQLIPSITTGETQDMWCQLFCSLKCCLNSLNNLTKMVSITTDNVVFYCIIATHVCDLKIISFHFSTVYVCFPVLDRFSILSFWGLSCIRTICKEMWEMLPLFLLLVWQILAWLVVSKLVCGPAPGKCILQTTTVHLSKMLTAVSWFSFALQYLESVQTSEGCQPVSISPLFNAN